MSASPSTKLQANFKLADGTLINVYADDNVDFQLQLNGLIDNIPLLAEVSAKLVGSAPAAPAFSGVANGLAQAFPGSQVTVTNTAPQASIPEGSCKHGVLVWREGQGPKGPWKGYFCPSPKGTPDQCSPKFVR